MYVIKAALFTAGDDRALTGQHMHITCFWVQLLLLLLL
jgi:hypothetical protein